MAATSTCIRCFAGSYVGGVCNHCGRPLPAACEIVSMALPVGYVLHGRYYMGYPLGHGGFGITYPAYDLKNNRRVAVKEFFPTRYAARQADRVTVVPTIGQESNYASVLSGFRREASILLRLQGNDGIVELYHAFEANGTAYYVMELLEGEDMKQMLTRSGRFTWQDLAPVIRPVLLGVSKVHAAGLIHRDISPDNIYLTDDGGVRLIDFGSARAYMGADHFTVILKHGFAPWEQYLTQGNQGPWTDVYSLCATIYYALSGVIPMSATERRVDDRLIPLDRLCPDVPANVSRAIERGMAISWQERFQTVNELYNALFLQQDSARAMRMMTCRAGALQGSVWQLQPGAQLRMGRGLGCEIRFPNSTPGISRVHCTVAMDAHGRILVRDEGAKYGTLLVSGSRQVRLAQGQWYGADGCLLCLGAERFQLP